MQAEELQRAVVQELPALQPVQVQELLLQVPEQVQVTVLPQVQAPPQKLHLHFALPVSLAIEHLQSPDQ